MSDGPAIRYTGQSHDCRFARLYLILHDIELLAFWERGGSVHVIALP